jgi:uncharacterized protein (DUF58 family)
VTGPRFLDPAVLARISNLELLARTVVEGFISGLHHSPYLGLSTDFAEHRPYTPGDDIRRIDWRVFGRTDRFYVREFEADTNANFAVLLDVSRSMEYGSGAVTKLDYARFLAAALVYLARKQRDRVGLVTFEKDVVDHIPASAKRLEEILHALDRLKAGQQGGLFTSLATAAEQLRRRSMVALLSDLYEAPDEIRKGVALLRARGMDVMVFHIMDQAELTFPFGEAAQFEDLETGERMPVVPETLREQYLTQIRAHMETVSRVMEQSGADYWLADTSRPLDFALFEYLSRRERMKSVR